MSQQAEKTRNEKDNLQQLSDEPTISDVADQAVRSLREYAKQRPDVVAMWCFGIGFVVGWKLKPW